MECRDAKRALDSYLDRELEDSRAGTLEQHLESCSDCRALMAERVDEQGLLREAAPYYRAPEQLQASLRAALTSPVPSPRRQRGPARWRKVAELLMPARWWALPAAFASTVIATWAITYSLVAVSPAERQTSDMIASYSRSLITERPVDVASSDQHTVKPWFNGRINYAPTVIDLAPQGFPLVGGRLDFLEGARTAVLVYRHRLHTIDLFVRPQSGGGDLPIRMDARLGFNIACWSHADMSYCAVSDLGAAELGDFARAMRSAMR